MVNFFLSRVHNFVLLHSSFTPGFHNIILAKEQPKGIKKGNKETRLTRVFVERVSENIKWKSIATIAIVFCPVVELVFYIEQNWV